MGDKSMRPALSHQRQNPAKLLLVDSDDVGNGVEVLFSQHLFWHLCSSTPSTTVGRKV